MVVVGGLGTILGSIMGATLITYLQYNLLKNITEMPYVGDLMVAVSKQWFTVVGLENFSSIVIGLIMIGIIIFEPLGMFGVWIRMKKYWMTWPFKEGTQEDRVKVNRHSDPSRMSLETTDILKET